MNKNKGFTLIEIIAVIIILGIIMIIAIPNISSYIASSKKDTYIVSLNRFIEGARELVETKKDVQISSKDVTYYIPKECIPVDKDTNSPYGAWLNLYVVVTFDGLKHHYYITARDEANYGVDLVYSDKLGIDKINTKKKSVATNIGVGNRHCIMVIGSTCSTINVANGSNNNVPIYNASRNKCQICNYVQGELRCDETAPVSSSKRIPEK
jgi:prepilin-type N-terminal cleavage/methylation domain-containing protein